MTTASRFTRTHPCPICGGHRDIPQGRGERCYGYLDSAGEYARCTRPELAGALPQNDDNTYSHHLRGDCKCGTSHQVIPLPIRAGATRTVAGKHTYVIKNAAGDVVAYHDRTDYTDGTKSMSWRSAAGTTGLRSPVADLPLYGSEHLGAHPDWPVIIVEGERAADALRATGIHAVVLGTVTGAATVPSAAVLDTLRGRKVALWPDHDDAGRKHMRRIAAELEAVAMAVRIIEWTDAPPKGDAVDYLATHTKAELVALIGAARSSVADAEPFALGLDDFLSRDLAGATPLIGTEDDNLLPTGGLLILFAKGGSGKTTLVIDAAFCFAAGKDWLGTPIPRPIRVLIIENEGPQRPFQRKLARKAEVAGAAPGLPIFIKTMDWGAFTFGDDEQAARLRRFVADNRIDLVIGDPLDSLGIEGVGSPEDTRKFMQRLVLAGLTRDVAFLLLHHPTKAPQENELDEASGAWGGRPDTMLRLARMPGNRARLSFPKVRWGEQRQPRILAFDPESESFEVVSVESSSGRDLHAEIMALLGDGKWRTLTEIYAPKAPKDPSKPRGIGANRGDVEATLNAAPDVFVSRPGNEVGRSPKSTVWALASLAQGGRASRASDPQLDLLQGPLAPLAHPEGGASGPSKSSRADSGIVLLGEQVEQVEQDPSRRYRGDDHA